MMNDVRTNKMRTYNLVSRLAHPAPPLARADCGPMQASGFNILVRLVFFCAGLRTSPPGSSRIAIPRYITYP